MVTRESTHSFWNVLTFAILFALAVISSVSMAIIVAENRPSSLTTVQSAEVGR